MTSRLFTLVVACAGLACSSSTSLDEVLEAHRKQSGLVYRDCGTTEVGIGGAGCESVTAAEQCLLDAFLACEPAMLRVDSWTIEGDPIPAVLFVEPAGVACSVAEFDDNSADAYKGDYGDVQQFDCTGLEAHDNGACQFVRATGCELVREW